MRLLSLALSALVLLQVCGCDRPKPAAKEKSTSGNPVTAPVDYLGAVGQAQKAARQGTASASLTQAIRLFQEQEGRLPKDLQELVSRKYLPRLPEPPKGMRYQYDPKSGQVRVVAS